MGDFDNEILEFQIEKVTRNLWYQELMNNSYIGLLQIPK